MMETWQPADVLASRHCSRHDSTPGGTYPDTNLTDPRLWYDSRKSKTLVRDFSQNVDKTVPSSGLGNTDPSSNIKDVYSGENLNDKVDLGVGDMSRDSRTESDTLPPIHSHQTLNQASNVPNDSNDGAEDGKEFQSTGYNKDQLPVIQSSPPLPESISHIFNNPLSAVTLPHINSKKVERTPGMTTSEYDAETIQKYNDLRLPQHESQTKTLESFRDTYVLRQKSNIKFKTDVSGNKRPHAVGSGTTEINTGVNVNKRIATHNASNRKPFYKTSYPKVIYPHFQKRRGNMNPLDGSFQPLSTSEANTIGSPQPSTFTVDTVNPYRNTREQAARYTQPDSGAQGNVMHIKLERNSYRNHMAKSSNDQDNDRKAAAIINLSMRESMSANDHKNKGITPSQSMDQIISPRSLRSLGYSPSHDIGTGQVESCLADSPTSGLSNIERGTDGKRKLYLRKFKKLEVFGESKRPETSHRGRLTEENPNRTLNAPVLRPPNYRLDKRHSSDSWTDPLHTTQESINIMRPTKLNSSRNDVIEAPQKKLINLAGPPESADVNRTGTWHKGLASRRSIRLEVTFKQKRTKSIPDSGLIVQTPSTPIHETSSLRPYSNDLEGLSSIANINQHVANQDAMDLNSELDHASTSTTLENIEAYVPPNTVDTEKTPTGDQVDTSDDVGMFTNAENNFSGEIDQVMDIDNSGQLSADSLMDQQDDTSLTLGDRGVDNTMESSDQHKSVSPGAGLDEEQRETSDMRSVNDTDIIA